MTESEFERRSEAVARAVSDAERLSKIAACAVSEFQSAAAEAKRMTDALAGAVLAVSAMKPDESAGKPSK